MLLAYIMEPFAAQHFQQQSAWLNHYLTGRPCSECCLKFVSFVAGSKTPNPLLLGSCKDPL